MAKLKFNTNPEATSSFMPYDGPTPPEGSFNARIKNPTLKMGRSGNPYINGLFELESNTGSAKQYNGFPLWGMVNFVSEYDNVLARFNSFIRAIGGKVESAGDIVHASDEDLESSKGSAIKSIAGAKVDGKLVRVTLKVEKSEQYGEQLRVEMVSPLKDSAESGPDEDEDEDVDVEVESEEDEAEVDDEEYAEREAEQKKFDIPALRAAAKEAGLKTTGLKKAELVQLVLDWEFSDEDADEDEDAEETEDDEEVEVDVEDDEEGDEDEEEEEEDDEEEEEEDVDEREAALAELEGLDRTALKKRLKELDDSAKVLKSMSDDDIKNKIVDAMTEPPF